MDIYVGNKDFERVAVFDDFESFIWTERYSGYGDFEMVIPPGLKWDMLRPGVPVMHDESNRVMVVESREEVESSDGAQRTTIKGRSLERLLEDRVVFPNSGSNTNWVGTGPAGRLATRLVREMCVHGTGYTELDIIPGLSADDLSINQDLVTVSVKRKSLYDAVKELCDSAGLGFSITLTGPGPQFQFFAYEGVKRDLIFSSDLNNLTEESLLFDWTNYKNTAYVWTKDGTRTQVIAPKGETAYREGLARRVLYVDASDIDPAEMTEEALFSALQQRGREELAKLPLVRAFDGLIVPGSGYRYGTSYRLGDIVTLKDRYNVPYQVRVTEHIWSIDASSSRSYPTFVSINEEV